MNYLSWVVRVSTTLPQGQWSNIVALGLATGALQRLPREKGKREVLDGLKLQRPEYTKFWYSAFACCVTKAALNTHKLRANTSYANWHCAKRDALRITDALFITGCMAKSGRICGAFSEHFFLFQSSG